ncbi:hypothetical protein AYO38_11560 [bacterium SCGC AG-212-C10]|nr:hypothetical protein AYO38_11560 [bacterium SCGC AG-212-C10]
MHLLILGGTQFVGRHLVESALAGGHTVTLFNRGQTAPGLYPGCEEIHGDRATDLHLLAGRTWGAVIDPAGYVPRIVRTSVAALRDAAPHYTFISSISAYGDMPVAGTNEDAPMAELVENESEDVSKYYGELKTLCEREVQRAFGDGALIVRPGMIVGPYDPTDRFTYWPVRVAEGGAVLAPGDPDRQVQLIHARDLADWVIRMVEARRGGAFNATGPAERMTMRDLVEAGRMDANPATIAWATDEWLLAEGVTPWMELPFWLPESNESTRGMLAVDVSRAVAAGLTHRPLAEIARSTLAWAQTRPADHEWRAGMKREREAELLAKLKG